MSTDPIDAAAATLSDALVLPLVECAADALRALEPEDVPTSLKHLRGFDRRGLLHGPGPRQLRRIFASDAAFRERVAERFAESRNVAALLDAWRARASIELVEESVRRGELPLLASVLWACRPEGADFGLGLVVAIDARNRRDRDEHLSRREQERQLAALSEATRRAEVGRREAQSEAARAQEELRKERHGRRSREEQADAEAQAALRRAEALDAQLRQAHTDAVDASRRFAREVERARTLEEELRRARSEIAEFAIALERAPSRLAPDDARALADATASTQRLAAQLAALRTRVEAGATSAPLAAPRREASSTSGATRDRPLARRVAPPLPAGMLSSSVAGIEAMLRGPGVLLVIDGYNVTKRGWPEAAAADQRSRLGITLTQLNHRLGCRVLCVFDGDGSGSRAATAGRGGIRVVFSDAEEEADEVVVREVENQPKRVPVVVASSDAWVREHAEAAGAVVVPADALLAALRKQ